MNCFANSKLWFFFRNSYFVFANLLNFVWNRFVCFSNLFNFWCIKIDLCLFELTYAFFQQSLLIEQTFIKNNIFWFLDFLFICFVWVNIKNCNNQKNHVRKECLANMKELSICHPCRNYHSYVVIWKEIDRVNLAYE